jgi:pyruvate dehydrogenase (quinone)
VAEIASEALIGRLADWGARSGSASSHPPPAASTCLTVCTTPSLTTCRCWRSPGCRRRRFWAPVADLPADGSKTAILAGSGALHARGEILAVAEKLAAPIVKTLSGKGVVPDDSPYTTGGIGLLGTKPSEELMEEIDTLLSLRGLLPLLKQQTDTSFLEQCQKAMRHWREKTTALPDGNPNPIAPQYVVGVLDELAADDAIMTCDSGTIATWAARHWHIRGGRQFFVSGNLATMAPGLPYANAIQHAMPRRLVVADHDLDRQPVLDRGQELRQQALSHDGPALVYVNVNPDEPPLPGKVEYEQAKKFAEAFLKGQPRRATIASTLFHDNISQFGS